MPIRSTAPFPALPDIEPPDDGARFAPVTFKPRALGSLEVCLGPWAIGELQPAERSRHAYQYIVRLPGMRQAWRRPVPLDDAKQHAAELVRQWIEATPVAGWVLAQARASVERSREGRGR